MEQDVVDAFVDPGCPWTWVTSRWIDDVARQRSFLVRWRPFSLALLNQGRPVPERFDTPEFRERMGIARQALRELTRLGEQGEHEVAGRFYAEFGRRFHDGEEAGGDPVAAAIDASGAAAVGDAPGDIDEAIERRLAEALALAGPDIGSPVIRIGERERGLHGPILGRRLQGERALAVFDAITALHEDGDFFEVKRGRSTGPQLGADR